MSINLKRKNDELAVVSNKEDYMLQGVTTRRLQPSKVKLYVIHLL